MKTGTTTFRGMRYLLGLVYALSGCMLHPKPYYRAPNQICYSDVPGFSDTKGVVLEWEEASKNDNEPIITTSLNPPDGLRLRWLGTAGFEISDDSTTILIDPFVSRPTLGQIVFAPLKIDTMAVRRYILEPLRLGQTKAILVGHPHHDHFQDVPFILAQYRDASERPVLVGSRNVQDLIAGYDSHTGIEWVDAIGGLQDSPVEVIAFDVSTKSCRARPQQVSCEVDTFGAFKITAFVSDHSSYDCLGPTAIEGRIHRSPPVHATDYKMLFNTSIDYLIEYRGLRIFVAESPIVRHAEQVGKVDILIQGIAARREYNTLARTIAALQPDYVIPSHYDDFFKPLSAFDKFDVTIGLGPLDFSRFALFVDSFARRFGTGQPEERTAETGAPAPKLRLMKLLYYYSLTNLTK